jgi:hypothetical protein
MVSEAAQVEAVAEAQPSVPVVDQGVPSPVPAAAPAVPDALVSPASESYDLKTMDGVRAAIEAEDALRNYIERERLNTANTERQRVTNEWRKDALERAQAVQERLREKYRVELDDEDAQGLPLVLRSAEEYARGELNRLYVQAASEHFGLGESETLMSALKAVEDDPQAANALTSELINAIHAKGKTDALEALTPEELAENPKFKDFFTAKVAELQEAEMTATQIEANKLPQAPAVPSGSAVPSEEATVQSIIDMPEAERMAYLSELALNNPEEFERIGAMLYAAGS